jgi:hypothetical protein
MVVGPEMYEACLALEAEKKASGDVLLVALQRYADEKGSPQSNAALDTLMVDGAQIGLLVENCWRAYNVYAEAHRDYIPHNASKTEGI